MGLIFDSWMCNRMVQLHADRPRLDSVNCAWDTTDTQLKHIQAADAYSNQRMHSHKCRRLFAQTSVGDRAISVSRDEIPRPPHVHRCTHGLFDLYCGRMNVALVSGTAAAAAEAACSIHQVR